MLTLLFASILAYADPGLIHCDYVFAGLPFSSVEITLQPDGHFGPAARVFMQGASHLESYSEQTPAANESVHGWISKESPENRIELVIYKEAMPLGQSK